MEKNWTILSVPFIEAELGIKKYQNMLQTSTHQAAALWLLDELLDLQNGMNLKRAS